jgi:hypothetical protein
MGAGKIADMHVVADAGAIGSRLIIAEDFDRWLSADRRRRLDVKMTLGAARSRAPASGARRFLSGCRREFPTISPGQNLSSARVELSHVSDGLS